MHRQVWILQACHCTVPGWVSEVHMTRRTFRASARELRAKFGREVRIECIRAPMFGDA